MEEVSITDLYALYLSTIDQQKKSEEKNTERVLQKLPETKYAWNGLKPVPSCKDQPLQEFPEIKPVWNGRKPVSPRKVALKSNFGKITFKDIMFFREMNGIHIMGDYEHKMTMDGCTCHEDFDVFPIKQEPKQETVISKSDIQSEIEFRMQEIAMNTYVPKQDDDTEYTIIDL